MGGGLVLLKLYGVSATNNYLVCIVSLVVVVVGCGCFWVLWWLLCLLMVVMFKGVGMSLLFDLLVLFGVFSWLFC